MTVIGWWYLIDICIFDVQGMFENYPKRVVHQYLRKQCERVASINTIYLSLQ